MLMWCKNAMIDEEVQKELEHKVVALLEGPLKDKNDYAQEKCIKSFYEGLSYLEKLLLKQNNIHPHDGVEIMSMMRRGKLTHDEYLKKQEEVRQTMKSEISRQFRHFLAFL